MKATWTQHKSGLIVDRSKTPIMAVGNPDRVRNTLLVLAAPDLLAACKGLLAFSAAEIDKEHEARKAARAAIEKAEGRN